MDEYGEITRCYTITFERRSKHPAERVWQAITDPEQVSTWMRFPAKIDARRGGGIFVDFSPHDPLDGVITDVDPGRKLAYAWGRSIVEWTVEPDGDGCRYTFIHQGLERREGVDEEGLAAGWHGFLDAMEGHLDGSYISREQDAAEWERLKPLYKERLEAALH